MLLFFYGVLLDSVAEGAVRDLLHGLGTGQAATVQGLLYAVPDRRGFYPVLVEGEGVVRGMVHQAGAFDLAALDRFEGVVPHDPHAGEYRRESVVAELAAGGKVAADAYLYNRVVGADLIPIPHGDFARWLRENEARAFSG